jgi:putative heme-binding domain-containing protein
LLCREPAARAADLGLLTSLLDPRAPSEVQMAAVATTARARDAQTVGRLLSRWSALGPALRSAVLDAILERAEGASALLDELEHGAVPVSEIDAAHRQRLLKSADDAVRLSAEKRFASGARHGRQELLESFRPALSLRADSTRGKAVFGRICALCHQFGGQGHEVGPDLAALTDTSGEALLLAILDPNREVDARYTNYTAALSDGRILTGLIAAETGNAITLKRQEGQTDVVLRADLDDLKSSGQSLMPEGLERDLSQQDLADVIAYVAGAAEAPKVVAGNRPATVQQADDGTIRLTAETAAIYGATLVYESEFGNLGHWESANDRASWTFKVDRPATFTVTIEWACADESAGNPYEIRVGTRVLPGTVGGTGAGTWSQYHSIFVNELVLPAGTHKLEFRPSRAPQGALLDLRAVVLSPRTEKVFAVPEKR